MSSHATPSPPSGAAAPLTLAAAGTHVEIAPALGGRVTRLVLAGRDWLQGDDPDGAGITGAGGYVERLPTVAACTIEVPGLGTVALPDGGELWSQHAPTERLPGAAAGTAAVTRWTGDRLPYDLARTVAVEPDGAVRMAYALTSRAPAPIPFLWAAHPHLAFAADTRLDLPVAARVRVAAQQGVELGGAGAEHRWPILRVGGAQATRFGPREIDFTQPAHAARRFGGDGPTSVACTLVVDLPRTAGRALRLGVEQAGARLELEVDPAEVSHLVLRLAHGAPDGNAGGAPRPTLGFAPGIGAPDALSAALGPWHAAAWLAPGETRRWTLTWRGRAAPLG